MISKPDNVAENSVPLIGMLNGFLLWTLKIKMSSCLLGVSLPKRTLVMVMSGFERMNFVAV